MTSMLTEAALSPPVEMMFTPEFKRTANVRAMHEAAKKWRELHRPEGLKLESDETGS
jgi:hypothetical protein